MATDLCKDGAMQASGSQENLPPGGYPALKRDILRGVFAPGEKLLMSALKARYGLGVGPLREALSQLVAEHLVVAISQRGFRVAPMSLAELADIYDARAHLEAMILGLAIARGDDAWEAQIVASARLQQVLRQPRAHHHRVAHRVQVGLGQSAGEIGRIDLVTGIQRKGLVPGNPQAFHGSLPSIGCAWRTEAAGVQVWNCSPRSERHTPSPTAVRTATMSKIWAKGLT